MKFTTSILKRFAHAHQGRDVRGHRELLNPMREWVVSLVIALIVACGLFGYAGWIFYEQSANNAMPEVSTESIPRYRAVDAELLIRYYEGKEQTWNERVGNTVVEYTVVEEGQDQEPEEATQGEEVVSTESLRME